MEQLGPALWFLKKSPKTVSCSLMGSLSKSGWWNLLPHFAWRKNKHLRECCSHRTVTRRTVDIEIDLELQLQNKADNFYLFFLALNKSYNVRYLWIWNKKILDGETGSNASNERDNEGEWLVYRGKCVLWWSWTKMGQTGMCYNRWLSKCDRNMMDFWSGCKRKWLK